jgi:hypothetical protein
MSRRSLRKRAVKNRRLREERALDALLVLCLRGPVTEPDLLDLPALTEGDRAALDALGPDFVDRLVRGERPLSVD